MVFSLKSFVKACAIGTYNAVGLSLFVFVGAMIWLFMVLEIDKNLPSLQNYAIIALTLFGFTFIGVVFEYRAGSGRKNLPNPHIQKTVIKIFWLSIGFLISTIILLFGAAYFSVAESMTTPPLGEGFEESVALLATSAMAYLVGGMIALVGILVKYAWHMRGEQLAK